MGGWIVECDGESVEMPFVAPGDPEDWIVPTLDGRFPDAVIPEMDEDRFRRGFVRRDSNEGRRLPHRVLLNN